MTRYRRRFWFLAAGLSALAGCVDAIGFLKLGGLFVSFMSGNSTRLAVGAVEGSSAALVAAGLIAAFVGGVMAGSLLGAAAGAARKAAVLALATGLLAGAALLDGLADERWTTALMAAAMGATNCVFQRGGEVSIGVTYMTGTLVKLGQHLAAALLGTDRSGWVPYLVLWIGLVAGALTGAFAYPRLGAGMLWAMTGVAACLAGLAHWLGPEAHAAPAPS